MVEVFLAGAAIASKITHISVMEVELLYTYYVEGKGKEHEE